MCTNHFVLVSDIPEMENAILPLLVRGEVGAIPIATGEVQRQRTRKIIPALRRSWFRVAPHLSLTLSSDKERGCRMWRLRGGRVLVASMKTRHAAALALVG